MRIKYTDANKATIKKENTLEDMVKDLDIPINIIE